MVDRHQILQLLETNPRAVGRALVVLYNNQTADEQVQETVKHHNNKGFRPCDVRMGTSMAKFFLKNGMLTEKQVAYWRRRNSKGMIRIGVYTRQLLAAAKAKGA